MDSDTLDHMLTVLTDEMDQWLSGRKSWCNLHDGYGDHPGTHYPHDVIAVMDTQEVVKRAAAITALVALKIRVDNKPLPMI